MNPRTRATLDELARADWFARVGQKDTGAAIVLDSWKEAIESCSSDVWQDLLLEAANQYRMRLVERSKERFSQWNAVVREVRALTNPLVEQKFDLVQREHDLPKVVEDSIKWDILHAAMEAEFADVYPPGFSVSNAYWYVHGHFPCGWEGKFPEGKLIIF